MKNDKFSLPQEEADRLERFVGPKGVWYESSEFQLRFLKQRGLTEDQSVLDVGCGVLRGGIRLIDYLNTDNYFGVDIRECVINEGLQLVEHFNLKSKSPVLIACTDFGSKLEKKFDVIWAFQVLYHLTDELADQAFKVFSEKLLPSGVCYINVNTKFGNNNMNAWEGFPFLKRDLLFYEALAKKYSLTVTSLGQLKDFGYTNKVNGQYNEMLMLTKLK